MSELKKILFALAVVVALGASTASAQVQFFVSASSPRPIRVEGLTEATGNVVFAAQSTGTIKAGSTITLDYGTAVEAVSVNADNAVTTTCTVAPVPSASGNVVVLTYAADSVCAVGNSISVNGIRVNANALASGTNVNVTVSSTVPVAFQATNPISIIQFSALTVATVQGKATTTSFTAGLLQLCNPPVGVAPIGVHVIITMTENFAQALLSKQDEKGVNNADDTAGAGGASVVKDLKIRYAFKAVPIGVRIESVDTATSDAGLKVLTASGLPFTSASGAQDVDVDIIVDDDDSGTNTTGSPEKLVADFIFNVPTLASLTTVDQTGTVSVSLRGSTTVGEVPRFASNTQVGGDVIKAAACASYLLFPWAANTGNGQFDTGMAIINASADPPALGTKNQTGDVTLYFFKSDGSAGPAPVKIATALKAGAATTYVLSSGNATAAGVGTFTGYIIAVCTFQFGHGFGFINNPQPGTGGAFAEGYLPLSLTNPRLAGAAVTESVAH
jgi:hypothetical protein